MEDPKLLEEEPDPPSCPVRGDNPQGRSGRGTGQEGGGRVGRTGHATLVPRPVLSPT